MPMRVPVKELCCHPPTVGHRIWHDETAWQTMLLTFNCLWVMELVMLLLTENNASAHSLLDQIYVWELGIAMNLLPVFHVVCCNEIAMESKATHSLTYSEIPLSANSLVSLTSYWARHKIIVPIQVQHHLLPVGHDMRYSDEWQVHYCLQTVFALIIKLKNGGTIHIHPVCHKTRWIGLKQ